MKNIFDNLLIQALRRNDKVSVLDKRYVGKFYDLLNKGKITDDIIKDSIKEIKCIKEENIKLELRANNDILEAYVEGESKYAFSFLVFISQFFENYDYRKYCLYTSDKNSINEIFEYLLITLKEKNIKEKIIKTSDFSEILNILLNNVPVYNQDYYNRLINNFDQLVEIKWSDYKEKMFSIHEQELYDQHIEEITSMELPDDWDSELFYYEDAKGIFADNSSDGLILSLNNLGRVDIPYISQITGLDYKTVITDLSGSIFQNPDKWNECFYEGWETSDEYLSGRILDKLKVALAANDKYKGYFSNNVAALSKIKLHTANDEDIYITLGSPWVPIEVIEEFVKHAFLKNYNNSYNLSSITKNMIKHDEMSSIWEIDKKIISNKTYFNEYAYSTRTKSGLDILEMTLNKQIPVIYDTYKVNNKYERILNKDETILAKEKQKQLINDFKEWVSSNPNIKNKLIEIYNDKYCSNVIRKYDGSFLKFNNMNKDINLYDYQKNAIARIIFSPNTLLAHDVGSGKTFIMIASGMEKRRLGLSRKNIYVVPNNLVAQWEDAFKSLYPNSNILVISPNNFKPHIRLNVLNDIKNKDYDGIIIAYSCFEQIPISKRYHIYKLEEEIKVLRSKITLFTKNSQRNLNKLYQLQEEIIKLKEDSDDNNVYFEDLGINTLYLDEAHNYKNYPVLTQNKYVLGISNSTSKKCVEMYDKVKIVQSQNNGGGVVFATATPITNSLTDIFVMQKYLQEGELKLLNLQNFDDWVGMFTETKEEFEIDVDTNNYRIASRYSKFHNMQEFSLILSSITDFHQVDKEKDLPTLENYIDCSIKKTETLKKYLDEIYQRAKAIREKNKLVNNDNMLKITTDGRKAALDMRLIDENNPFDIESKVFKCAENIYKIYKEGEKQKTTQVVFCDYSTPKKEFNIYDELKRILISFGINKKEIAFIHEATTNDKRRTLFEKIQIGEIRVIIGSTFKLGIGVNIQNKLVALHHLDIPWRPSDMIQREGRILRTGNENEKVQIYRYITEGSFDAYSWQILETKQKMIRDILSGNMTIKMCDELNDTVLNYGEIKALALGNPLLKEQVELINELQKYKLLQNKLIKVRTELELELIKIPSVIKNKTKKIKNYKEDFEFYKNNKKQLDLLEQSKIKDLINKSIIESFDYSKPKNIMNYQGFDIIIPNNLLNPKKIIYLQRKELHKVEVGNLESRVLFKINDYLNKLDEIIIKELEELDIYKQKQKDIESELAKENDYVIRIKELNKKIKENNIKLGVSNNE